MAYADVDPDPADDTYNRDMQRATDNLSDAQRDVLAYYEAANAAVNPS